MKTKKIKIEQRHNDQCRLLPESVNDEERTVELVFTTSDAVKMYGYTDRGFEIFNESLSLEKGHVNLDRMKRGAPLLDSHDRYGGLQKQLGVVQDVWVDGDELHGRVKFSKKDEAETVYQDVKDGIIKNASIGYRVYKYDDISSDDDKIRTLKAVKWEGLEISLVTVPADPRAQVRSEIETEKNDCEIKIKTGEKTMPPEIKESQTQLENAKAEERQKAAKIIRACRQAELGDDLAEKIIDEGHSYSRALEIIQEKWAEKDQKAPAPETPTIDSVEITRDEKDTRREAMADAIIHRHDPKHKVTDASKEFMHMNALDICREISADAGFRTKGISPNEIIKRAFHSTGDFTAVLENVASKRLEMGYESVPQVWRRFMSETTLRDFKLTSIAHLDEAPNLELIGEGAEIKYGTMGDSKEVYQLGTYAKGLSVTRQTIINDDLGAFAKVATSFGRAGAHLENQVALKGQIIDNPTMGDGNNLFDSSTHSNVGSAGALSETTLSGLEQILADQLDSQGREMELRGSMLLVGTGNRTTGKKLLANQSTQGGFNVFGDEYELLVSSLVAAGSYYLIANPNQIENVEYAYLEGARGMQIESEQTFDVLGVKIRAYLDFAAKAINWRSMAYNAGS
jgi:HK97 family phage prohead protease